MKQFDVVHCFSLKDSNSLFPITKEMRSKGRKNVNKNSIFILIFTSIELELYTNNKQNKWNKQTNETKKKIQKTIYCSKATIQYEQKTNTTTPSLWLSLSMPSLNIISRFNELSTTRRQERSLSWQCQGQSMHQWPVPIHG